MAAKSICETSESRIIIAMTCKVVRSETLIGWRHQVTSPRVAEGMATLLYLCFLIELVTFFCLRLACLAPETGRVADHSTKGDFIMGGFPC